MPRITLARGGLPNNAPNTTKTIQSKLKL